MSRVQVSYAATTRGTRNQMNLDALAKPGAAHSASGALLAAHPPCLS